MQFREIPIDYRFSRRTTIQHVALGLFIVALFGGLAVYFTPWLATGGLLGLVFLIVPFVTSLQMYHDRLVYSGLSGRGTVYRSQVEVLKNVRNMWGVLYVDVTIKNTGKRHTICACGPADAAFERWFQAIPVAEWVAQQEKWERIYANPAFGGTEASVVAAARRHSWVVIWWALLGIAVPCVAAALHPVGNLAGLAVPVVAVMMVVFSGGQWCLSEDRELPRLGIGSMIWFAGLIPLSQVVGSMHYAQYEQVAAYSWLVAVIGFGAVSLAEGFFRFRRLLVYGVFYVLYGYAVVGQANLWLPQTTTRVSEVQVMAGHDGGKVYRTVRTWHPDGRLGVPLSETTDYRRAPVGATFCVYERSGGLGLAWRRYAACPGVVKSKKIQKVS